MKIKYSVKDKNNNWKDKTLSKERLAKLINDNNLYIVCNGYTTDRVYRAEIYVLVDNTLLHLGNYQSSVIGMSRVFDIFCEFINDYGLNNYYYNKDKCNKYSVKQAYNLLGNYKISKYGASYYDK